MLDDVCASPCMFTFFLWNPVFINIVINPVCLCRKQISHY